jgi:hypothetical protein
MFSCEKKKTRKKNIAIIYNCVFTYFKIRILVSIGKMKDIVVYVFVVVVVFLFFFFLFSSQQQ